MEIFEVVVGDELTLKGREWASSHPRANLLIATGMCEHSFRYEEFALFLANKGINVSVLDAVGQGLNVEKVEDLQKWHGSAFEDNVDALALRIKQLKETTKLPTYIMGHSMGSFMVQRFLTKYPSLADKAVLMGSNGPQKALMKMGYFIAVMFVDAWNWNKPSHLLQSLSIGAYESSIKHRKDRNDWLSYDEKNVETYNKDPYCGARNTNGFWKVFLKSMAHLWEKKELQKLDKNTPILLVAGEDDPVGRCGKGVQKLEKMYLEYGVKDVQMILYPQMRHEILNEGERRKDVYQDIYSFLEK